MKRRNKPRAQQVVFDELAELCASPGYIEAFARLSLRDNIILYDKNGLKGDALAKIFSHDRLIRTETATLMGLMLRQPLDVTPQAPEVFDDYCTRTDALMQELHDSFGSVFDLMMPGVVPNKDFNPFQNAEAMREPIFYGAESAFPFQYREFAVQKYLADDAWLEKIGALP